MILTELVFILLIPFPYSDFAVTLERTHYISIVHNLNTIIIILKVLYNMPRRETNMPILGTAHAHPGREKTVDWLQSPIRALPE